MVDTPQEDGFASPTGPDTRQADERPSDAIDLGPTEETLNALAQRIEDTPYGNPYIVVDHHEAVLLRGIVNTAKVNYDAFMSCLPRLKEQAEALAAPAPEPTKCSLCGSVLGTNFTCENCRAVKPTTEREAERRMFPIMRGDDIPWSVIAPHESQALVNHNQSLERLAQRGGLAPFEAVCVIKDVVGPWKASPPDAAEQLAELVKAAQREAERRVVEAAKAWYGDWITSSASSFQKSEYDLATSIETLNAHQNDTTSK